jgi:DNA-binding winged helix-turn-helix (wHTH) protein
VDEKPVIYRFGAFEFDPAGRSLRSVEDGCPICLTGKVFDTLLCLVERRGRVVEKRTLLDTVWPNVIVEESNLKQTISMLRRALGDDRETPSYIATISGRGYQFIADVEIRIPHESPVDARETDESAGRAARMKLTARLGGRKLGFAMVIVAICGSVVLWVLNEYFRIERQTFAALERVDGVVQPNEIPAVPGFANRPSIAVLPFEFLGPDPEREYIADGVTEDLITRLAGWRSSPSSRVAPRSFTKAKPSTLGSLAENSGRAISWREACAYQGKGYESTRSSSRRPRAFISGRGPTITRCRICSLCRPRSAKRSWARCTPRS